jgi:hypothetical protein
VAIRKRMMMFLLLQLAVLMPIDLYLLYHSPVVVVVLFLYR